MTDNMNDKKTVVALGKFDGMHIGHVKLLETAVKTAKENKALSMVCFIGFARQSLADEGQIQSITRDIGVDMLHRQELTPEFMNMSAREFVSEFLCKRFNCSHVVAGYNFRFAKGRSAGAKELSQLCSEYGIECIIIPEVTVKADGKTLPVSSTLIRELVTDGEVKKIKDFLGRFYSVSGKVTHGRHLGSTLDFPTANIIPPKELALLPSGVYVTVTEIDKKRYLSVTNIGNNPTVADDNAVTVETFVFDFSNDIYGKNITVHFLEKIRGEVKFSSLDELKNQVEQDKGYAFSKKEQYKEYI
ncbi:MAG: bifunctional riboflavin kinase/FAD synthetase [Clostridia bacterium]|nr:bifunctional riboflavin kinase/FAD synthetase [Clostridia bacterium]